MPGEPPRDNINPYRSPQCADRGSQLATRSVHWYVFTLFLFTACVCAGALLEAFPRAQIWQSALEVGAGAGFVMLGLLWFCCLELHRRPRRILIAIMLTAVTVGMEAARPTYSSMADVKGNLVLSRAWVWCELLCFMKTLITGASVIWTRKGKREETGRATEGGTTDWDENSSGRFNKSF